MKRSLPLLAAALAFGCVSTAAAGVIFGGSTDFEDMPVGALPADGFFSGATDSEIVADATVATAVPEAARPANFEYAATRERVLSVNADSGAPLLRSLQSGGAAVSNEFIYADLLVKGALPVGPNETVQPTSAADKILVYFKETEENGTVVGTNLYVRAGAIDDNFEPIPGGAEYKLATPAAVGTIDPDAWYRLVLVSIPDLDGWGQGFQIHLGGYGQDYLCTGPNYLSGKPGSSDAFPSLDINTDDPLPGTVSALAFSGQGLIDDLVLSTNDPEGHPPCAVTLSWPTFLHGVEYVVDGETNALADASAGSATVEVPADSVVTLVGYGARILEAEGIASGLSATLSLPADIVAWYFPQTATPGQDGSAENPFEIATESDLWTFQNLVCETNCAGLHFAQTADIALPATATWPGIGIQNGKDIYNTTNFDAGAFSGVYDGQNHTVSGFQMEAGNLDYCGFFNSTFGATIQNLRIQYKRNRAGLFAEDSSDSSDESGATFVGVAKNSTLRNLVTVRDNHRLAPDAISCAKGIGGIVGYLTSGSVVDSCTNNVNFISLKGNKAGGIAMITQNGAAVTIRNCQNNGETEGNPNQKGGIVGYVGVATIIEDCEDTANSVPTFLHHQAGTVTMQGVNRASADYAAYTGSAVDGLAFATVDEGVATFVKGADLVTNVTYYVMGPGATYNFTEAGTITFVQSLATPTVTAAEGLTLSVAQTGGYHVYTAEAEENDPWFIPEQGADAATIWTNLGLAGLSPNTNVVRTAGDYVALVGYATNRVAGAAEPADLTANQRTNAVLCFALNAAAIPDAEIADGDLAVAAVEPAAGGAMEIAISIDGVTVGDLSAAAAQALAARALAGTAGGDDLDDLSADNVTIRVTGSENGDILAEVVPNPDVYDEPPAAFFVRPAISK